MILPTATRKTDHRRKLLAEAADKLSVDKETSKSSQALFYLEETRLCGVAD
jgi:hypothetical protein